MIAQFSQASIDRVAGNACCPSNRRHPAMASGQRLSRRKTTPTPLIQHRIKRSKPQPNGAIVDHTLNLAAQIHSGNPPHQNQGIPHTKKCNVAIQLFINTP